MLADQVENMREAKSSVHNRAPRESVLLSAEVATFGSGAPSKHRIRDLSATGARIDQAGMLGSGATILVSVGLLDAVGATVIWVQDGVAGLKFAVPINPDAARAKAALPPSRSRRLS
jgi:hypothetical protein